MSTKTIGQLESSNQLDINDFIVAYNAESLSDHVTYKTRIGEVLALKTISVNGKTGSTITLTSDDIGDVTSSKKFVSITEKNKIGLIRTDQGTSSFLAGDGTYRPIDLSYSGQSFVTGANNLGGIGLFTTKSGNNLQIKGLVAGSNITLTPTSTGITISSGGVGGDYVTESTFNVYTGSTLSTLNSKLNISGFNAYTGTTQSALDAKLSTSLFNGYTGATAPSIYLSKSGFNIYSGLTETRLLDLESASGSSVTSSNGLTKVGDDIQLGGSLIQDTVFTAANTHNLFFGQVGGEELVSLNIATTGGYSEWNAGEGIISLYSSSTIGEGAGYFNVLPYGLQLVGGFSNSLYLTLNGFQASASAGEVSLSGSDVPVRLSVVTSGGSPEITTLTLTPSATTSTLIIDSQNATFEGIKYGQDFSDNFNDRSLIDKGFADATYMPIDAEVNDVYWKTTGGTLTLTGGETVVNGSTYLTFQGNRVSFGVTSTTPAFNVGSQSTAPSSPENGDVYYNNSTHKLMCYANGTWVALH